MPLWCGISTRGGEVCILEGRKCLHAQQWLLLPMRNLALRPASFARALATSVLRCNVSSHESTLRTRTYIHATGSASTVKPFPASNIYHVPGLHHVHPSLHAPLCGDLIPMFAPVGSWTRVPARPRHLCIAIIPSAAEHTQRLLSRHLSRATIYRVRGEAAPSIFSAKAVKSSCGLFNGSLPLFFPCGRGSEIRCCSAWREREREVGGTGEQLRPRDTFVH